MQTICLKNFWPRNVSAYYEPDRDESFRMNKHDHIIDSEEMLITRIRELSSPMTPQPTDVEAQLLPLPGVRTVLFDVYGTMFMSASGDIHVAGAGSQAQALRESLACAGFTGRLEEAGEHGCDLLLDAIRATHATQRDAGVAFPEVDIREEWSRVLHELQKKGWLTGSVVYDSIQRVSVEYEFRVNPVWPMADMQTTLQALWDRGVLLGLVSNAQFYTLMLFPAFFSQSFMLLGFNPYLCAFSYEIREAKPSTKLFTGIVEQLEREHDVTAAETLYVGNDMLNDVWAASKCGLKTALFAGDTRSLRLREDDARCAEFKPDAVITSLSQLLDIVKVPG